MIIITAMSLPFLAKKPIDLPPIVSVELIQITDKTNIPFAPKARKIIDKVKEEEKRVVSEQAPPSAKAKEKPDRIPLPNKKKEEKKILKKKQNPEEIFINWVSLIFSLLGEYYFDQGKLTKRIKQTEYYQLSPGPLTSGSLIL